MPRTALNLWNAGAGSALDLWISTACKVAGSKTRSGRLGKLPDLEAYFEAVFLAGGHPPKNRAWRLANFVDKMRQRWGGCRLPLGRLIGS